MLQTFVPKFCSQFLLTLFTVFYATLLHYSCSQNLFTSLVHNFCSQILFTIFFTGFVHNLCSQFMFTKLLLLLLFITVSQICTRLLFEILYHNFCSQFLVHNFFNFLPSPLWFYSPTQLLTPSSAELAFLPIDPATPPNVKLYFPSSSSVKYSMKPKHDLASHQIFSS